MSDTACIAHLVQETVRLLLRRAAAILQRVFRRSSPTLFASAMSGHVAAGTLWGPAQPVEGGRFRSERRRGSGLSPPPGLFRHTAVAELMSPRGEGTLQFQPPGFWVASRPAQGRLQVQIQLEILLETWIQLEIQPWDSASDSDSAGDSA